MKTNLIGIIFSFFIIVLAIGDTLNDSSLILNYLGLLIVVGGTFAAGIVAYGLDDFYKTFVVGVKVFSKPKMNPIWAIDQLMEITGELDKNPNAISNLRKRPYHPFILDGLRLIENDFSHEKIEEIMFVDLEQRQERQLHEVEIIKNLAKYPPAFGMIGTVIGLIGLLSKMNMNGAEFEIGSSMAIALLTTLYGLVLANYFLIPMSDNLLHRLNLHLQFRKIIIEGILMLKNKEDPLAIREALAVYVKPSQREKIKVPGYL